MGRHSKQEGKKDRKHNGVITEIIRGKKYKIDLSANGQRIRETFNGNKTQALQRMEALRASAMNGVQVDTRRITYKSYSNQYLTTLEQSPTIRESTTKQYRTIERHIINHSLGNAKLVNITSRDVNKLLGELRDSGVGETTVYQVYAQMKRIFKAAIDDRIIQFSPVNKNVIPPVLPEPDRHALSRSEASRLCEVLLLNEPNACSLAALIALSTGLRIGEILGLTWENTFINCPQPHFNVIQQRTKERKITERKTSKAGKKPNAWVPIDPQLNLVLEVWRNYQESYFAEKLGVAVTEETPICSNSVGSWSDTHNMNKQFRSFCIEHGFGYWIDDNGRPIVRVNLDSHGNHQTSIPEDCIVEYYDSEGWPLDESGNRYSRTNPRPKIKKHYRGLKFHELRKTCFTLRLDRGESIKTLQAHGGWFSPRMLLENYGESVEESVRIVPDFLGHLQNQN